MWGSAVRKKTKAAVAIARKSVTGPLTGATNGRADKVNVTVPDGSHVIPADVVAALGNGNSMNGHALLSKTFRASGGSVKAPSPTKMKPFKLFGQKKKPHFADGGVPIAASDGEFIVAPEDVMRLGKGNADIGHAILNAYIEDVRTQNINNLSNLKGPAK